MTGDEEGNVADPMTGAVVGGYRIRRRIGEGGMGQVYAAEDVRTGFQVAIKVIAEEHAGSPALVERFFAEARAVNSIAHENIVAVHDLAKLPDGRPYIVMDLLEGRTVREISRTRRLPLGAVVHLLVDVLGALSAAHAVGVVHRDLKPDNVMVDPAGRAKLLDFGIAKLVGDNVGTPLARTRTGALLGTPEYMAPEQIECEGVDGRTDLYALGVLAFELIAGRRPFEGASDFEIMRAHVEEPLPELRALRPDLPVEVASVIASALAKDPSNRFQSARAMAVALHHASHALPDDAWGPSSAGGPPRPRAVLVLPRDHSTDEIPRPGDTFQTSGDRIAADVPSSSVVTRASRRPGAKLRAPEADAPPPPAPPPHARRSRLLVGLVAGGALTALVALVAVMRSRGGEPASSSASTATSPRPVERSDAAATADAQLVVVTLPIDASMDAAIDGAVQRTNLVARADAGPVRTRDAAVVVSLIAVDAAVAVDAPVAESKPAKLPPVTRTFHGFEPVGDISEIYDLARELVPNAELTSVKFWGVRVDAPNVSAEYHFRSPQKRDVTPCAVTVSLTTRWEERKDPNAVQTATARVNEPRSGASDPCDEPTIRRPTCAPQKIMAVAVAVPGHVDLMQQLTWTGQWMFKAYYPSEGKKWQTRPLPDQCP